MTEYQQGYLDGLKAHAWWKDGVEWVGTCGQTYAAAAALFLKGYEPEGANTGSKTEGEKMRKNVRELADKEILELAESDFNGELPTPRVGESPYYVSFYRMIFVLLERIKAIEARLSKVAPEIEP